MLAFEPLSERSAVMANAAFGRTDLILFLGAALALCLAKEMLFRRKRKRVASRLTANLFPGRGILLILSAAPATDHM